MLEFLEESRIFDCLGSTVYVGRAVHGIMYGPATPGGALTTRPTFDCSSNI
jgi:hypothetical protein